ncbi:MAG: hypothetical protein V7709_03850 [Halioglobus sp.]
MRERTISKGAKTIGHRFTQGLILCCGILFAAAGWSQTDAIEKELQSIQEVRGLLSEELAQYDKTLSLLVPPGSRAANSRNPAVKNIAAETTRIRQRLITITEREVTLIQKRIAAYKAAATEDAANPAAAGNRVDNTPVYSLDDEAEDVARLLRLLTKYYTELQESLRTEPTAEELAKREASQKLADELDETPFTAAKVRLSGAEGITALIQISQRLSDTSIPESRRDIAPICSIKTRFFGSLTASENRSLKPVGKNNYIARIRLQPGDTSLRIQSHKWDLRLPQDVAAQDYLVTLFLPRMGVPELHVFSVEDLLAQEMPYIPAWLPTEIKLQPRAG